jgi:hypothetical protein
MSGGTIGAELLIAIRIRVASDVALQHKKRRMGSQIPGSAEQGKSVQLNRSLIDGGKTEALRAADRTLLTLVLISTHRGAAEGSE